MMSSGIPEPCSRPSSCTSIRAASSGSTSASALIGADVVVVVALAVADRWLVDSGPGALALAIVALTPMIAWAVVAPTRAWAWSISAVLLGVLLASLGVSRTILSHGPAAPPIDWLLPYVALSIVICALAMTVARSWRWKPAASLAVLAVAASCWGLLTWTLEGDGGIYVPASDAAPLRSGLDIADSGKTECGNNGALCDRIVAIRTPLTTTEVRSVLQSHGWSEDCRPVTGILSDLGLYRYGDRCLYIHESRQPGVVVISLLGKAHWWSDNERGTVAPQGER